MDWLNNFTTENTEATEKNKEKTCDLRGEKYLVATSGF